jgi:uncharacterized protein
MGPLDTPEEAEGAACETLLFQELNALNSGLSLGYNIYYWRTSNNIEVDFILYGAKGIKAFEIKRGRRVSKYMLRGLKAFMKDYPMSKAYFIYGGQRYLREDNIEIIPIDTFFQKLPNIL